MTCLVNIQPLSRRSERIKRVYTFLALCFPLHIAGEEAAFEQYDVRWQGGQTATSNQIPTYGDTAVQNSITTAQYSRTHTGTSI